jgi:hypothetical protein
MKFQASQFSAPVIANPSQDNLGWEWSDLPGYSTVTKLYGTATGTASAATEAAKKAATEAARTVLPSSVAGKLDIGWPKEYYDDITKIGIGQWTTPSQIGAMFDHAAFWLDVGALRADYDGKKTAQAALKAAAAKIRSMKAEESYLCRFTGYTCTVSPIDLYSIAIDAVNTSGLDEYDVRRISKVLRGSRTKLRIKKYGPILAVAAAGTAVYVLRRRRR